MSVEKLDDSLAELTREEKIVKGKELYSKGSRNFLVKSYDEAADELSQVCSLYEEIYGELSDELGMPYLLYAKSLIALALDENKVVDVPEVDGYDDDEDDEEEEEDEATSSTTVQKTNGVTEDAKQNTSIKESGGKDSKTSDEADSTEIILNSESEKKTDNESEKAINDAVVTSTEDSVQRLSIKNDANEIAKKSSTETATVSVSDKPTTSNGDIDVAENAEVAEEDDEVTQSLQLAWQVLELAAKIFSRQGISGLPNLAEVQTELANIQFENNYLDAAREDYEKALKIYKDLPANYRRAKAEIHYKIGLTFLMQQDNVEGASSLKEACCLIDGEINEMQSKENITEKDKDVIKDMEETKEEILVKIAEIEEAKMQNIKNLRKVLDSVIHPEGKETPTDADNGGPSSTSVFNSASVASSSSPAITSSSTKPHDISHLIKRKKPDSEVNSEAEAAASPAKKRPV